VAAPVVTVQASSPRIKRVAKTIDEPATNSDPGRRGSMGCILEDKVSPNVNNLASGSPALGSPATGSRAAGGGGRRGSRVASLGGSRGSSRRGSTDLTELEQKPSSLDAGLDKSNTFSYWLQVSVVPSVLEKVILSHPAVDDCTVAGFTIEGVGQVPRAYISLKSGYAISAEDLIQYVNARVIVTDRLLGGLVFVDNLHRDPSGRLFVNLEKYDSDAQGIDEAFLKGQPKVQVM